MTTAHSQKPLALILGGGPRIGWSVATKLAAEGYKVALGSRNPDTSRCTEADILPVSVNVSDTTSVTNAFSTVKTTLGRVPSVVVYNAAALTFPADPSDPFASISAEDMERDYRVSALGAYAALREALAGFKALVAEGDDQPKVFIATGNVTPFMAVPMALTLAAGKSALVQMLQVAVAAYGEKGFRCVERESHWFCSAVC